MIFTQPQIEDLCEEIKKQISRPWLRPITTSLLQANNPVMMVLTSDVLNGPRGPVKGAVEAVTLVPKKWRALSAGNDASLIVWDIWTGERLGALLGHTGHVLAVAVDTAERFTVSGSQDPIGWMAGPKDALPARWQPLEGSDAVVSGQNRPAGHGFPEHFHCHLIGPEGRNNYQVEQLWFLINRHPNNRSEADGTAQARLIIMTSACSM